MNLVQVANDVKMLSDQQLQQIMQNPGSTPQYIIAGEMQRRQKLREDSSSPAQQGTVVDSLMTKVNQENEAKRKQSLMPMNEALPQGMGQPNIRGMASGGVVRMARGERPDEGSGEGSGGDDELQKIDINELLKNFRPYAPVQRPQAPDLTTQDYLAALAPRIAEMEGRAKQYEKGALSRALMKAGAAMMASKNSSALGGIGEGFGAGLGGYVDDKAGTTKDLQAMMGMRSAIAQAQQQAAEALANRRTDMYGRDMGAAIVDSQSKNAYGLNQDKMAADVSIRNADLPIHQADLNYKKAQLPYMAAMTAGANANALRNSVPDTPMAAILQGRVTGDDLLAKTGVNLLEWMSDKELMKIRASQAAHFQQNGLMRAAQMQEAAIRDAQAAGELVYKQIMQSGSKNPQFMTNPEALEAKAMEMAAQARQQTLELYSQYSTIGSGARVKPGPAPVAAAQPVVQYDPKTRKYK